MTETAKIVRDRDLEPSWVLKRATEPGFQRSLTTWVGGPKGFVNTHVEQSARSRIIAGGLMRMAVGNRQPGVHVPSVTESAAPTARARSTACTSPPACRMPCAPSATKTWN